MGHPAAQEPENIELINSLLNSTWKDNVICYLMGAVTFLFTPLHILIAQEMRRDRKEES